MHYSKLVLGSSTSLNKIHERDTQKFFLIFFSPFVLVLVLASLFHLSFNKNIIINKTVSIRFKSRARTPRDAHPTRHRHRFRAGPFARTHRFISTHFSVIYFYYNFNKMGIRRNDCNLMFHELISIIYLILMWFSLSFFSLFKLNTAGCIIAGWPFVKWYWVLITIAETSSREQISVCLSVCVCVRAALDNFNNEWLQKPKLSFAPACDSWFRATSLPLRSGAASLLDSGVVVWRCGCGCRGLSVADDAVEWLLIDMNE